MGHRTTICGQGSVCKVRYGVIWVIIIGFIGAAYGKINRAYMVWYYVKLQMIYFKTLTKPAHINHTKLIMRTFVLQFILGFRNIITELYLNIYTIQHPYCSHYKMIMPILPMKS